MELVKSSKTILVVDDDCNVRMLVKELLESEGYTVLVAAKEDTAVGVTRVRVLDCAVVDRRSDAEHERAGIGRSASRTGTTLTGSLHVWQRGYQPRFWVCRETVYGTWTERQSRRGARIAATEFSFQ